MWTLEAKLQELMNCSSIVSENLIRLLEKEENTPTFVSRYRKVSSLRRRVYELSIIKINLERNREHDTRTSF